jgi:hypothetical protein
MDTAQGPKTKCGAQAAARPEAERLDLQQVREKLAQSRGPGFWRSLDATRRSGGTTMVASHDVRSCSSLAAHSPSRA